MEVQNIMQNQCVLGLPGYIDAFEFARRGQSQTGVIGIHRFQRLLDGLREQLTEQKNVYESALKELKKNLRNERQLVQVKSQALNRRGEVVQDLRKKNGDLVAERDELVSKLVVIEALIKQIDPAAKKPILTEQLKKLAAQASVGTSEESSQLETSTEASIGEKPAQ